MTKPLNIVALMGACGSGKSTLAKALPNSSSLAFADSLKVRAKQAPYNWNGVKDSDGRVLLERVSRDEKVEFGNDVFALRTLKKCVNKLRCTSAKFVAIDDLRFGIEALTLTRWYRQDPCNRKVAFIHVHEPEADAKYARDFAVGEEYAWSAPELEWRAFANDYATDFFNHRPDGVAKSSDQLLALIKQYCRW